MRPKTLSRDPSNPMSFSIDVGENSLLSRIFTWWYRGGDRLEMWVK